MKKKLEIDGIGMILTGIGLLVSFASAIVGKKSTEMKINEAVEKAVSKRVGG